MMVIPFPGVLYKSSSSEMELEVVKFLNDLPAMDGAEAATLIYDNETIIFYRDSDAVAFRLKFGL